MNDLSHDRAPRVAVIDDEEDVLAFLEIVFQDRGYEVLALSQSTGAVARLAEFRPDLVCLDLLMPEQMGVSLFAELRSRHELCEVPVVVLSGITERDGMASIAGERGPGPPPAAYLEKPLDMARVTATVERLLAPAREVEP